ncbi:hypothetical protein [Azospirillum doebereinerae]
MTDLAEDLHPLNDNRRHGDVFPPVRPEIRETMTEAGFRPMDVGEGHLAWYRRAEDGGHALVSHNSGLDGDPATPDWIVGQYGERGGYVEVGGLSLSRALVGADTLPVPVRPDGSLVEALYPSLQQALDDLG